MSRPRNEVSRANSACARDVSCWPKFLFFAAATFPSALSAQAAHCNSTQRTRLGRSRWVSGILHTRADIRAGLTSTSRNARRASAFEGAAVIMKIAARASYADAMRASRRRFLFGFDHFCRSPVSNDEQSSRRTGSFLARAGVQEGELSAVNRANESADAGAHG